MAGRIYSRLRTRNSEWPIFSCAVANQRDYAGRVRYRDVDLRSIYNLYQRSWTK
jgi:hypothetical protein